MLASLLSLAVVSLAQAPAQAPKDPGASADKPYKLNARVLDEPSLPDLAGKSHVLFQEYANRALVLVFWSYRDPVSRFYAPKLAELQATYGEKAAFLLIDSNYDELVSAGDPLAKLRQVVEAEKVTLPLLLDHDNQLADTLGAVANGQVFLIDANRYLRYHGGIDDDSNGERTKQGIERRTWLANALDQVQSGIKPKEPWTRPSGRPIKRVPKTVAGAEAPKKP